MTLDARTLFFSLMVNVVLMSTALWIHVPWKSRSGIRAWNAALMLQAIGWAALILYKAWPRGLSTVGVGALTAALGAVYVAATAYLRVPTSRVWAWGVPLVTIAVHWIVSGSFVGRVAVANIAFTVQIGWTTWLLVRPGAAGGEGRWRWLAATALAMSGVMVAGRSLLVLLAPAAYPTFDAPHWINTLGLVVTNAAMTLGTLAFLLAHRDEAEQELRRLATTDGLTGTWNRRHWLNASAAHLQLAERHGRPVTVMMLDIDHFKAINDRHGHSGGDRALVAFARALGESVRGQDLVGRYGGEEFCVLLPESDVAAAQAVDRRLRAAVSDRVAAATGFAFTHSAGVAVWTPGMPLERTLAAADAALYQAKAAGRDRLVVSASPVTAGPDRTPPTTAPPR